MEKPKSMQNLAEEAKKLKDLPVNQQFAELGKLGLKITDTNWENSGTHPEQEIVIPVEIS